MDEIVRRLAKEFLVKELGKGEWGLENLEIMGFGEYLLKNYQSGCLVYQGVYGDFEGDRQARLKESEGFNGGMGGIII